MKQIIMVMTLVLLCFASLVGSPVAEEVVLEVGQKWYRHAFPGQATKEFEKIQTVSKEDQLLYYILSLKGGGFILVSADDVALPILGYSDTGWFEYPIVSPEVRYWMGIYEEQIATAISQRLSNDFAKPSWDDIRAGVFDRWPNTRAVLPLLQTTWDQGIYFNQNCPADVAGPGGRAYAGCVATAMAQVMKYWNWPGQGTGSHSYTDGSQFPPTYPGTLSANFGATTYTYATMPNNVVTYNPGVATLLYHCGVGVDMDYGVSLGSGALVFTNDAMKRYFAYDPAAQWQMRGSDITAWKNLMKSDLNLNKPIIYNGYNSATPPQTGHSFVMDGYNSSDYFHFNFGWSGYGDGYYHLDNVTPYSNNFSYGQWAYLNLFPGITISGTITDSSSNPISNVTVSFSGAGSVTTNAAGFYSITLSSGYTGTATPLLSGYAFTPSSRTYTNASSIQSSQNFQGGMALPADPSNLTATAMAYDSVQLNWTDNSVNETGFVIESRLSNDLTWYYRNTVLAGVTNYLDIGLMPLQTYIYRVRAFNVAGNSNSTLSPPVTTLTPPPPGNLNTQSVSYNDATINWFENGSAQIWDLEFGAPGFTPGTGIFLPMIPNNPFFLQGLQQGTPYEWYVRSFYPSVNVTSAWAGPGNFMTLGNPLLPYPWTESFENGFVNLVSDPSSNTLWALDAMNSEGTQSAWNAYQANNTNILVTTNAFSLATASSPFLYFDHIAKLENNYDHGYVEISTDNGVSWQIFPQNVYRGSGSYQPPTSNNPEGPCFMESSYPGWSADTPDNSWWKTEIFDLQAYQGIANLMLRFRLKADSTVQEHGWHIDNVQVKESPQYDFSLDTPLDSYLLAGGSLDYTATIRNKGSQPDDFNPSISGLSSWTYTLYQMDGTTLLPAAINIPPWAIYQFIIRVSDPGSGTSHMTVDNEAFQVMSVHTGMVNAFVLSTTYLLGDTVGQPIAINSLPFTDSFTTTPYNHNYGPYGDASGLVNLVNPITGYYSGTQTLGTSQDVVYQLTLSQDTLLSIDLLGSQYDTALALVAAPGTSPSDVYLINDDYHPANVSYVDSGCNYVPAGTYYLIVGGWSGSAGNYTLNVAAAVPPGQPTASIQLDTTADQVILSWSQNTAMRYDIYSDTDPYGTYANSVATNVNAGTHTISGIPAVPTFYRVVEKFCYTYPGKAPQWVETEKSK